MSLEVPGSDAKSECKRRSVLSCVTTIDKVDVVLVSSSIEDINSYSLVNPFNGFFKLKINVWITCQLIYK